MTTAIKDPLLDTLNTVDPDSIDLFPLRILEGELVELTIRYNGGFVTMIDRLYVVNGDYTVRTFLSLGGATLPIDAQVRRECVGKGFVYESTKYQGEDR